MGIFAVHRDGPFQDYLVWLEARTRLHLRPAWTEQDIAEIPDDVEGNNPYDIASRQGRQVEMGPAIARAVSKS